MTASLHFHHHRLHRHSRRYHHHPGDTGYRPLLTDVAGVGTYRSTLGEGPGLEDVETWDRGVVPKTHRGDVLPIPLLPIDPDPVTTRGSLSRPRSLFTLVRVSGDKPPAVSLRSARWVTVSSSHQPVRPHPSLPRSLLDLRGWGLTFLYGGLDVRTRSLTHCRGGRVCVLDPQRHETWESPGPFEDDGGVRAPTDEDDGPERGEDHG